ncbi:MAG: hypothetical protein ACI9MR_000675 [Myxococcota bacterium]|jgi:hypothetical protein
MSTYVRRTLVLLPLFLSIAFASACDDDASDLVTDTQGATDTQVESDSANVADTTDTTDTTDVADTDDPDGSDDTASVDDTAPDSSADTSVDTADTSTGPTWHGEIRQFMVTYCVECHDSGSKDFRSLASVIAKKSPVRCGTAPTMQPGCGSWPPPNQFPVGNGPKPSVDERQMLVDWIDAGTPEGEAP